MTRWILNHKLLVLLAWVIVGVLAVLSLDGLEPRLDYTYSTPGQIGFDSGVRITQRFGIDPAFESEMPVLQLPAGMTMATPEGQTLAAKTFEAARATGPIILQDYATTHDPKFLLDGGRATWALISIPNPDYGPGAGIEDRLPKALNAAVPPGAKLTLTGYAQMLSNQGPNKMTMLHSIEIGLVLAFVVLLFVYGSPIAILPIAMALPSMLAAFLGLFALTYVTPVSYLVLRMIVVISLGISIDFALMVVIRWREERERGLSNHDAIVSATRSAGRAVALSGLTAAVGLGSLVVLPVPFLRSVGWGTMLIPFTAVIVAVTLLPVCLAIAGPALDRFSLWRPSSTTYSKPWQRWGRFILRHQWKAAALGLAFLVVTSLPLRAMETGMSLIGALVQTGPAADAFHHLQANGLPSGVDFPIYIMTHGGDAAAEQAKAIIAATPGVDHVFGASGAEFRKGQDALLTVVPIAEGSQPEGQALVSTLRTKLAALPGGSADVGGATAESIAFTDAVYGAFPLLLAVVSLVTLVVLTIFLRSIVLPLKAVILNIASLGSALGFMVFFWQQGHGSELIYGMTATGAVRMMIPTMVFASLFGLSMDYEVFVLSRVREEYDRVGDTQEAIVEGLAKTGRLVTCAALVLMVTLLSLSADPNQIVRIITSTLAVGVIVDAVIIRTLLLPALVSLMGRWNWWLPSWLEKILPKRTFSH